MIFENARKLRNRQTDAEKILWSSLKRNFPNVKFRRQHPILFYIVDFYCHKLKLVIEVDGLIHQRPEIKLNDEEREYHLKDLGLTVIRFTNNQVMNEMENVIRTIEEFIDNISKKTGSDNLFPLRGT